MMLKRALYLLFPFLLPVLVVYLLPAIHKVPGSYRPLITLLPYASLGAGLLLSWRFKSSRMFFSSLLLLGLYLALKLGSDLTGVNERWLVGVVSLMLPLNLWLLSFFKERGILTIYGGFQLGFLVLQAGLAAWLVSRGDRVWLSWLEHHWVERTWLVKHQLGIAQSAWISCALVVSWQLMRILRQYRLVESAVLSALIFGMMVLARNSGPMESAVLFGLAGLMLVVTLVQESYHMAYIDELTGLPGRRMMMANLRALGNRYSIAMIDIDHFKKFNDTYGHDVGDEVLSMVASRIAKASGSGKEARYGGEEFSIIFPGKSVPDVMDCLEAVRQSVESTPFVIRSKDRPHKAPKKGAPKRKGGDKTVVVTVSIGVAERNEKLTTPEEVMKGADKALYKAKRKGRNQVCS